MKSGSKEFRHGEESAGSRPDVSNMLLISAPGRRRLPRESTRPGGAVSRLLRRYSVSEDPVAERLTNSLVLRLAPQLVTLERLYSGAVNDRLCSEEEVGRWKPEESRPRDPRKRRVVYPGSMW